MKRSLMMIVNLGATMSRYKVEGANEEVDHIPMRDHGIHLVCSPRGKNANGDKRCVLSTQHNGPSQVTKRNMGLNLRSQVRFKTIKSVARKSGPFPSLSMPLMSDTFKVINKNVQHDGPNAAGVQDDVEICNSRPPDNAMSHTAVTNYEDTLPGLSSAGSDTDCAVSKSLPDLTKDLSIKFKVDILCIFEPRMGGVIATCIIRRFRFSSHHIVHAHGFSGGIWMFWKDDTCNVEIIKDHPQFIHARDLWPQLQHLAANISKAWVIIGDFNSYLFPEEKSGGTPANERNMRQFHLFLNQCGLLDLGFTGPLFTWEWRGIKERLDRGLSNATWQVLFPNTMITHLPSFCSNHKALLLDNMT
ncbi:Endonuclease/exonuclease/phosphatase superfamily [Sesbania bispinosa]|nr:Endonuclease/exonuclease/phosphatase superfamily [Sesbania bispinosa]